MSASRDFKNNSIPVVALAIRHRGSGKYMLAQRLKSDSGAGLWEFPGGKVESDESPKEALKREIIEELSYELDLDNLFFISEHEYDYPNIKIRISLWLIEVEEIPKLSLNEHQALDWFELDDLKVKSDLSPADVYFLNFLK